MDTELKIEPASHVSIWIFVRNQWDIMRILLIPVIAMTVINYPILLLASVMLSDSGTNKAATISAAALMASTVYTGSIILAFVKLSRLRWISVALILIYAACNLAAVGSIPDIAGTTPIFAIAVLEQTDINDLPAAVGIAAFAVCCIALPLLASLRLIWCERARART